MGQRIIFGILGIIALAVGTLITLGAAIAGVIGIAIVGALAARKQRQLTRRRAWIASVAGTIVVLLAVFGISMIISEPTKPMTPEQRAESRARAEEAMPAWMRQMNPNGAQRAAAADSMADKLLNNKPVMVWLGMMGAVIGSTILGVIAGTFAWGGFMLLYRGVRGRWLAGASVTPLEQSA